MFSLKFNVFNVPSVVRTCKSRKENPQKLTQLSSRSHPRHLVGKRTAQKDTIIDITCNSTSRYLDDLLDIDNDSLIAWSAVSSLQNFS